LLNYNKECFLEFISRDAEPMNIEGSSRPSEFDEATIASVIAKHAFRHPKRPAIVMTNGRVITYYALWTQIETFGAAFRVHGFGATSRVAVMLPAPEAALAIVATACHTAAVPLNPELTDAELDECLASSRIDAMVTSSKIGTTARDLAARHGVHLFEASNTGPGQLRIIAASGGSAKFDVVSPSSDTAALILKTSATTGRSKLVPMTHRNIIATAQRFRFWFDLTENDRPLCALPLYYAHGLKGPLMAPLLLGASVALPVPEPDSDIIGLLADLQPTWIDGGQAFLIDVLERARMRRGPLRHNLRFIRTGGAPLSSEIRTELEATFGVPVLEGYSLTEGTVSGNGIKPELRKSATVGRPFPNEVAIRAEDGSLLGPGETGEIVFRGPALTSGYLDDEEANSAAFVDGWFRTGDLGSIDAEGFLKVSGRIKEFINRGGEKISPYEIEQALLRHTCVREAAAFAVPHPRLGENVAVSVVLAAGANTTATEIKMFLADQLTSFKIPQQVFFTSALPKGATGKVLRLQLAEAALRRTRNIAPPEGPFHFQILEIWQRLLGRDDIGIDDDFFEAGGDSLLAVQMVCELEAFIGRQVSLSALRAVFTIRELAAAVAEASSPKAEMVTCAKQGDGTPFFFCHGDFTTTRGFYALKLTRMLTCDHPVFLVHPFQSPEFLTIEEMAANYLPQILAAHPTGAFRLGGYCSGGLIAWEIARRLERLGREIDFVILIDVPSLNARPIFRAMSHLNSWVVAVAPKNISKRFASDAMRGMWARATGAYGYGPYSRVVSNYFPQKIAARVLCIIAEESRAKVKFSCSAWNGLADEVHSEYIPGTHFTCVGTELSGMVSMLDHFLSQPAKTGLPSGSKLI
jgi:acyl-CoA synthetase (AMP-forming)/AMP-acid ligase II/acyl carrier protein